MQKYVIQFKSHKPFIRRNEENKQVWGNPLYSKTGETWIASPTIYDLFLLCNTYRIISTYSSHHSCVTKYGWWYNILFYLL